MSGLDVQLTELFSELLGFRAGTGAMQLSGQEMWIGIVRD